MITMLKFLVRSLIMSFKNILKHQSERECTNSLSDTFGVFMKKVLLIFIMMNICSNIYALNVSDVNIPESIILNNVQLKLNGYGIRKKWFIKVYIGSFYTTRKFSNYKEVANDNSEKVIKLFFLHKVEKNKVSDTIKEAFQNITPDLPESEAGKKFFAQFVSDFNVGDSLELIFLPDSTVITKHNNKALGSIKSNRLTFGLLSIYLGDKPVDQELKKGMLGFK